MIDNYDDLNQLLLRLGYLNSMAPSGLPGISQPSPEHLRLAGFILDILTNGHPDKLEVPGRKILAVKNAFSQIGMFLGLSDRLKVVFNDVASNMLISHKTSGRRIRREDNPVLYFLAKGHGFPGFGLLHLACVRLIWQAGSNVVPVALLACEGLAVLDPFTLLPEDIVATLDKHRKSNDKYLATYTKTTYCHQINGLIDSVRKVFAALGYGCYLLHRAEEMAEMYKISQFIWRHRRKEVTPPASSPYILPVELMRHMMVNDNTPPSSAAAYNEEVMEISDALMLTYGLPRKVVESLRLSNYEGSRMRLLFAISPDQLLRETVCFVPLNYQINRRLENVLKYRTSEAEVGGDQPLLAPCEYGKFRAMLSDDLNSHFRALSSIFHCRVSAPLILETHLYYYLRIGGMNPVYDDRISARKRDLLYVPRLYTQSSAAELRGAHAKAHAHVLMILAMPPEKHFTFSDEDCLLIGGKRAVSRKVIKAILDYYRSADLSYYEASLQFWVFLFNYCLGCRAGEMCSVTVHCINPDTGVVWFDTKNAPRRTGTTKSIKIPTRFLQKFRIFLDLRAARLAQSGNATFSELFVDFDDDGCPRVFKDASINDLYLHIIREKGLPYFTSHSLRYQNASDFASVSLRFDYINVVLAHYQSADPIWSDEGDISFIDFCAAFETAVIKLLEDYDYV